MVVFFTTIHACIAEYVRLYSSIMRTAYLVSVFLQDLFRGLRDKMADLEGRQLLVSEQPITTISVFLFHSMLCV